MKRVISVLLVVVMIFGVFSCVDLSAFATNVTISNRAEWLSKLASVFDMEVESDNYPDNYFSDLPSSSEYYYDVLLAVEFGVVDIEAGEPVNPEGNITREFAAQTLNYCLGWTLEGQDGEDGNYTFADWESCNFPYHDQVAVNREWFALDNNKKFSPAKVVTANEINTMLDDAEKTLKEDEVKENYDSTFEFEDDVIEVAPETKVDFNENEVVIYSKNYNISSGDTFVVYSNEIPVIYTAKQVSISGNKITVKTSDQVDETAVESIDMQTVFDVDTDSFIPAEGYEVVNNTASCASADEAKAENGAVITLSKKLDLGGGKSFTISAKISNIEFYSKQFTDDKVLTTKVSFDLETSFEGELEAVNLDTILGESFGVFPIAGIGYFEIKPVVKLSGKLSVNQSYNNVFGFTKDDSGIHNISSFKKDKFSVVFELSGKIGVKAEIGVTIVAVKIGLYAEAGFSAKASAEVNSVSGKSMQCTTISAYLYFNVGVELKINLLVWKYSAKLEWKIFKESNSPIRLYFHFENGVRVNECTAGKQKYITPDNSKYGNIYTDSEGNHGYYSGNSQFIYRVNSGTATIGKYIGTAKNVLIPSKIDGYKVTGIGDCAFEGCSSLTSITIPNSVTSIGEEAFWGCSSLTSITIPNSVTSIGGWAFEGCSSLTSITIPYSVTKIYSDTFEGCNGLTKITVDENNRVYDSRNNCNAIIETRTNTLLQGCKNTIIPDTVRHIDNWAFYGCTGLTSVAIPNSVTSIGQDAFSRCSNLTSVAIGNSVESIGEWTFHECESLTSITIPDSVTRIGKEAFSGCSGLSNIKVQPGNFDYDSRNNCNAIIETRTNTLLQGCKNTIIPDTVRHIDDYAFYGCTGLTSVAIPDSVKSIGEHAFSNCSGLTSVTIGDSVTRIGDSAFSGCSSLASVSIGYSVTSIGWGAFYSCSSLKSINIPDSVTSIGNYAFYNCSGLTSITIPNSVTSIGNAFWYCTGLTSITIPDSVTYIGNVFCMCTALTSVSIGNSVKGIGAYAFDGCSSLTTITIPDSVTGIGKCAFRDCTGLTSVAIPDSVKSIGEHAFSNCSGLTSVTIGDSVTRIGDSAFSGCSSLASVSIGYSVTSIGWGAFYSCSRLTSITIPDSVTSIGSYAFECCSGLTSVTIGDSVTRIDKDAFYNCSELTDVYFNGSQEQWDNIGIASGNDYLKNAIIHYNYDPAHTHSYTDVVTAPTCTEQGYTTHTCECGDVITDTYVPALGHDFSNNAEVCRRGCGTANPDYVAPVHVHAYTKTVVAPKATAVGYTLYKCACGDSYKSNYKAPTGKPAGFKCASRSATSEKFTWTKTSGASGYQVQISNAKGNAWGTSKALTANSYTFSKLTAGSAYKARVRFYIKAADGKNYYGAWTTITSPTLPAGTSLVKVTAAKKAFTAQWKKGAVTGYQLQYATNNKFSGAKTVTIKKAATLKYSVSKLAANKTFYVRVRTYKAISGANYYSAWSAVKAVKTK